MIKRLVYEVKIVEETWADKSMVGSAIVGESPNFVTAKFINEGDLILYFKRYNGALKERNKEQNE